MIASDMLYLTGERDAIVVSGDPRARFVLANVGDEVPEEYAALPILDEGEEPEVEWVEPELEPEEEPVEEEEVEDFSWTEDEGDEV